MIERFKKWLCRNGWHGYDNLSSKTDIISTIVTLECRRCGKKKSVEYEHEWI